ncbi:hypothetical protein FSP39_012629 [Pinctada imbricata]|uniref:Large ribosomal subunit protein uL10m n=1 Tax=Pinctada imbricata TaxID=66713 RepID=A0AA88XL40_PINIB|nr:hypothetical protein FSP39_012629 [Pinctada imbricata]
MDMMDWHFYGHNPLVHTRKLYLKQWASIKGNPTPGITIKGSAYSIFPPLGRQIQQVRHGSKKYAARAQKPKTLKRLVYNKVTEPLVYRPVLPQSESCFKARKKTMVVEVTPYEKFLMKETRKLFEENSMIAFCHVLPIKLNTRTKYYYRLREKNYILLNWASGKLMRQAMADTRYKNILPLCRSSVSVIISKNPDLPVLLSQLKKMPEYILMGMLWDDKLLNVEEVGRLAKVPNIESLRGEFVSILNLAGGQKSYSLLSSHQQVLAMNLDQYVKQCEEDPSKNTNLSQSSAQSSDSDSSDGESSSGSDSD